MAVGPILDVMSQLIVAHEQLLALGEQKTDIIVRNNVEELNKIVGKEARLTAHIAELDQIRITVVGQYLTAKGYRPHPYIAISDIVKLIVRLEEKQAIQEAQRKLLGMIERIKEVNQQNQLLIKQSLSFIDYSLDLIAGSPEDEVVYHHPAQQQVTRRTGMFDTRA